MASAKPKSPTTMDDKTISKAEKELNENLKTRQKAIDQLRKRLNKNKQLIWPDNDVFLIKFLRARKYDLDRAEKMILTHYRMRAEHPKFCDNVLPSVMKSFIDCNVAAILPGQLEDGVYVYMFRPANWKPDLHDITYLFKMHLLALEYLLENNVDAQVHGIQIIADLGGVGWAHVTSISREYARLISSLFQDAFPLRIKGMQFVNEPTFFSYVFPLIKSFMKSKIINRMNFHGGNLLTLQDHIPKSILPNHLDGEAGEWADIANEFGNKLKEKEDFYKELTKYRLHGITPLGDTNESLIQVGDGSAAVSGTFKKLNVD